MRFVAQRLAHGLFVLWAVVTILFLMFRLMPGDPMAAYISEALPEESQNAIRAQFGLDKPLWQQYLIYLANLARGELGTSFHQRQPVLGRYLTGQISGLLFGQVAGGVLGDMFGWRSGLMTRLARVTTSAMSGASVSADRNAVLNMPIRTPAATP